VDGRKLALITSDGGIERAAEKAGCSEYVIDADDYFDEML